MEKGKLLAQLQEKILSTTIKEITPFGTKLEFNTEGQVAGGLYAAQHIETANFFLKTDGTLDFEARAMETTKEGDVLMLSYSGTGKQTGIASLRVDSQALIMTQSTRLAQLNNSRIRTEINVDFANRDVSVKYYTL